MKHYLHRFVRYLSLHRRPISAILADMTIALWLAASIGRAISTVPGSSQHWVAVMFAVIFVGITTVIRCVWGTIMRRLEKWSKNCYVYRNPPPIEPDAEYYAFQFVLCYTMIAAGFITIVLITSSEEQLINAYVVGTMLLAVSALIAICVGIRRLYEARRTL